MDAKWEADIMAHEELTNQLFGRASPMPLEVATPGSKLGTPRDPLARTPPAHHPTEVMTASYSPSWSPATSTSSALVEVGEQVLLLVSEKTMMYFLTHCHFPYQFCHCLDAGRTRNAARVEPAQGDRCGERPGEGGQPAPGSGRGPPGKILQKFLGQKLEPK